MHIQSNNRPLSTGFWNVVKQYAWENNKRTWNRIHLEMIVENNGRTVFFRFQISDTRKV
jgi:hypothetical protein